MSDTIPFSEAYWDRQGLKSPFLKPTHFEFKRKVRSWVEKRLIPNVNQWDREGTYPRSLHKEAYDAGVSGATWPKEYGGTPPEGYDFFHSMILTEELARCGCGGLIAALFSSGIGLPPILKAGSAEMKERIARPVITGEKIICLCITEPGAGSDVAALRTTARRDGDYYIVNGAKKFITSGMRADYFTVAVRTGSKSSGMMGISMILIEKTMPGITTRRLPTQGWLSSNTAFVSFDNVKVPVSNLIGKEGDGFKLIMHNFNNERFMMANEAITFSRVCLIEAVKYARFRKTFGQRLVDHQVIRHKIAEMARMVECSYAWLESLAQQINSGCSPRAVAGPLALLKVQSTRTLEFCAREASQILGGASYLRSGPGQTVERLYREVRVMAIGGGSEEVMLELAMRQSML